MDYSYLATYLVIYLVITLVIILICRELVCWYFKINKTIAVLEEIRDLLKYPPQAVKFESKVEPSLGDNSEENKIPF